MPQMFSSYYGLFTDYSDTTKIKTEPPEILKGLATQCTGVRPVMFHINQQHRLEENWRTSVSNQCQVSASNQNVDIGNITTIAVSPEWIS